MFLSCSAYRLGAQEVKFVDLSDLRQTPPLRVPTTKEPNCTPEPCVATKDTSVGGCTTDVKPLRVVLDWVAPHDITLDPFKAEFRILNAGNYPVDVPLSPRLGDLQPSGNPQRFGYISLSLGVVLFGIEPVEATGVGWIDLYGSAEHQGTLLRLKPGQWMRVRTSMKLHTWPSQEMDVVFRGNFRVRRNMFKPDEHGAIVDSLDLCPNRAPLAGAVEVRFVPIHLGTDSPQRSEP